MQQFTIYFLGLVLTSSCGQVDNNTSMTLQHSNAIIKTNNSLVISAPFVDSTYVILQNDSSKQIELSIDEIKEIDKITLEYIIENKIDLDYSTKYKRQYVPQINDKGEKEIWVNYFCDTPDYWKTNIVLIMDGGNCYFQFIINLSTKKISNFSENGVA